ncbi:hypothetical protein phiOC_p399 [Ochrobactrum phage vB_OspM_OC]|nr:hypothetical protein phiOC_p399 [Ochrobactrum phage vB_OspM_OC]
MSENDNNNNQLLLARLDERTQAIQTTLGGLANEIKTNNEALAKKLETTEAKLSVRINELEKRLNDRIEANEAEVEKNYVSKESFIPIQKIVYGGVGLILVTVFGSLIALAMKAGGTG